MSNESQILLILVGTYLLGVATPIGMFLIVKGALDSYFNKESK